MDVNGDGRDDIVCGTPTDWNAGTKPTQSTNWDVYISSSTGFTHQVCQGPSGGWALGGDCVVGDFNGDGLSDLACQWDRKNFPTSWTTLLLSTGKGWSTQTWTNGPVQASGDMCMEGVASPCTNLCTVGDFDGDGIDDIVCNPTTGNWAIGFGGGNSSFEKPAPGRVWMAALLVALHPRTLPERVAKRSSPTNWLMP